jgi:hypothetical protein
MESNSGDEFSEKLNIEEGINQAVQTSSNTVTSPKKNNITSDEKEIKQQELVSLNIKNKEPNVIKKFEKDNSDTEKVSNIQNPTSKITTEISQSQQLNNKTSVKDVKNLNNKPVKNTESKSVPIKKSISKKKQNKSNKSVKKNVVLTRDQELKKKIINYYENKGPFARIYRIKKIVSIWEEYGPNNSIHVHCKYEYEKIKGNDTGVDKRKFIFTLNDSGDYEISKVSGHKTGDFEFR